LIVARYQDTGCGNTSDALSFGGYIDSGSTPSALTEK